MDFFLLFLSLDSEFSQVVHFPQPFLITTPRRIQHIPFLVDLKTNFFKKSLVSSETLYFYIWARFKEDCYHLYKSFFGGVSPWLLSFSLIL